MTKRWYVLVFLSLLITLISLMSANISSCGFISFGNSCGHINAGAPLEYISINNNLLQNFTTTMNGQVLLSDIIGAYISSISHLETPFDFDSFSLKIFALDWFFWWLVIFLFSKILRSLKNCSPFTDHC
jgi:hypothetical protein